MEGIDDIVRQIRCAANMPNFDDRLGALALAKRIEAAYERGYRALQVQIGRLEDANAKAADENAKLKRHLGDAVKLAESISVTVCREGREEELHLAEKSPVVKEWKLAIGEDSDEETEDGND